MCSHRFSEVSHAKHVDPAAGAVKLNPGCDRARLAPPRRNTRASARNPPIRDIARAAWRHVRPWSARARSPCRRPGVLPRRRSTWLRPTRYPRAMISAGFVPSLHFQVCPNRSRMLRRRTRPPEQGSPSSIQHSRHVSPGASAATADISGPRGIHDRRRPCPARAASCHVRRRLDHVQV